MIENPFDQGIENAVHQICKYLCAVLSMLHECVCHGRKTRQVQEHTHCGKFPTKDSSPIFFYDEFRNNPMHAEIVACIMTRCQITATRSGNVIRVASVTRSWWDIRLAHVARSVWERQVSFIASAES